jgi:hypothetical protein
MTSPARVALLASMTGLGATALHAAVRGEPGPAVIGALTLGFGVLVTIGVILPWLEMYGPVVSRGPAGNARIALTFDDGPHPVTTRRVLEALAPTRHRRLLRAGREGAPPSRCRARDSRRRPQPRHPR